MPCSPCCSGVPSHFSHVRLFVTPWTASCQAPLSVGFSRQEYWSRLPCPSPGDLSNPGIEPESLMSPALAGRFFTASATWIAHLPCCPSLNSLFSPWTPVVLKAVFADPTHLHWPWGPLNRMQLLWLTFLLAFTYSAALGHSDSVGDLPCITQDPLLPHRLSGWDTLAQCCGLQA